MTSDKASILTKVGRTTSMKPLLAAKVSTDDLQHLDYPVLVSPKLDGIRCLIVGGMAVTRSLKPIPNDYIRNTLSTPDLNGLDGEILVRGKSFSDISSGVMSKSGEPDFEYWVFDDHSVPTLPFRQRLVVVRERICHPFVLAVSHEIVSSGAELLIVEDRFVSDGYEGIMIRSPDGIYKYGRSTKAEGILLKLKRLEDSEAMVVGFVEQLDNHNDAVKNALGYTERSSHKANKTESGTLGAIVVNHHEFGSLEIGTGFDSATRKLILSNKEQHIGKQVKFRYQPSGMKDKPRFPVFVGFRDECD
ncbi:DNA ligase, phage-associated [Gammaproteobacteria bacterium]